jgi:glycosyltransferase involved in cell wall biosynthesis
MKKLLILAYDFPPYVSVGGLRPYNWYKYLKEYGVEPIVVTRQWENKNGNHLDYIAAGSSDQTIIEKTEFGTILRTPYHPNFANRLMLKYGEHKFSFIRKAISAFFEFNQFLLPIGPKAELYHGARAYLKENKVDAIIATGDPFVLFSYASQLSKEFGIPWIADYRDPWSHNQEYAKSIIQKLWNRTFEKKTVLSASYITTVSNFVHDKIDSLVPGKPYSILPNGYDPEVIDRIAQIPQQTKELQIAFVGTIYDWHPLESFLRVCNEFIQQHPSAKFKLNFYGTNVAEKLKQLVTEVYPLLENHTSISPKIPNADLLEKLAQNNVMLLFNYYSYMGTKIFDYLGIRRKMILCYANDSEANKLKEQFYAIQESASESKQLQADLIHETNSGIIVQDSNHLKQVLQDLYAEFEEKGFIACDSVGVENYSRKIQVEKLAGIVKKM